MIDDEGIGEGFEDWIGCWMYIWGRVAGSGSEEACMQNTLLLWTACWIFEDFLLSG